VGSADPLAGVARRLAREAQRFAAWDPAAFATWTREILDPLEQGDPRSAEDLGRLVVEALGRGLAGSLAEPPRTWLDAMLRGPVPGWLRSLPARDRAPLLVRAWNLGEGCASGPRYLDRYVRDRVGTFADPASLPDDLARALAPLTDPVPTPSWRGPFQLAILDLRATDPRFLPGALRLAGPRVLAVADRRRDTALGILLGPEPVVLGAIEFPGEPAAAEPDPVELDWGDGSVEIGEEWFGLPLLGVPRDTLVAPAGYAIATAANSQRLWIVSHA
jgi:hypothetical protein